MVAVGGRRYSRDVRNANVGLKICSVSLQSVYKLGQSTKCV